MRCPPPFVCALNQGEIFLTNPPLHLVYIPSLVLQYKYRDEEGKTSHLPANPTGAAETPNRRENHYVWLSPTPIPKHPCI